MTGGRKRFLYRIVVDTWPTPDGQPFDKQPAHAYAQAIDAWHGGRGTPEHIAWMSRIDWAKHLARWQQPDPLPGVWFVDTEGRRFTVPQHRRAHFLNPTGARTALSTLQSWGAHGHIERSDPITWKGTTE
jgi:hypothetical protein